MLIGHALAMKEGVTGYVRAPIASTVGCSANFGPSGYCNGPFVVHDEHGNPIGDFARHGATGKQRRPELDAILSGQARPDVMQICRCPSPCAPLQRTWTRAACSKALSRRRRIRHNHRYLLVCVKTPFQSYGGGMRASSSARCAIILAAWSAPHVAAAL